LRRLPAQELQVAISGFLSAIALAIRVPPPFKGEDKRGMGFRRIFGAAHWIRVLCSQIVLVITLLNNYHSGCCISRVRESTFVG
jgi:hypothetical protein